MAYDFLADDPFGVESAGIECEGTTENTTRQDNVVNDNEGEPVAGDAGITGSVVTFNNRKELTANYKSSSVAGVADKTVTLGGDGTVIVTQVQVTGNGGDNSGPAQIAVTGHSNLNASDVAQEHDADSPAYTVTLPTVGFGVPTDPLGAAVEGEGTLTCLGFRWTASILNHKDKLGNVGQFLAGTGRSVGCRIECEADYMFTGAAAPTIGAAWKDGGRGAATSNGDYSTITLRGFMYQAADA